MQKVPWNYSFVLRYGAGFLSVILAIAVRRGLGPILGSSVAPFASTTAAVMFTAWLVGTGPAVFATILGLGGVELYFLAPTYGFQQYENIVHIVTYLVVCVAALLMSSAYRRSAGKHAAEMRRREETERELLLERDALREAEEKFRAVAEIASSAILIQDGERVLYMNRASEELLGYTRDELFTGDMWSVVHPDYRHEVQERVAELFRGGAATTGLEHKVITKSGEEKWLDAGAKLISFEGQPCILVSAFDITDRKSAEEVLRNREEHYRAATTAGKICTWEWDLVQDKLVFSDNWYALTSTFDREYEFAEDKKRFLRFEPWRQSIHEDDRVKIDAAIESAIQHDTKYEIEYRVRQKNTNDVRWLAATGRVLRDHSGNPLRMIGAAVDITERRFAEEALRNSEKLAATGRLAASIAHEINNPLEAVTNLIFLARTAEATDTEREKFLTLAEEELRRAAHLTKQTLGFYRDSSFATDFVVSDVIDDVLSLYSSRIDSCGVTVKKRFVDPGAMHGMVGEIRQAVSNLIANAIDAMPGSGGSLHLRIRRTKNSQNGSALRITVGDTGMGIPAELHKRIFEPFFTTKQETGTGLGLWLTKSIVEKHGGTILVSSSTTGKTGTAFMLTIPESDSHLLETSAA